MSFASKHNKGALFNCNTEGFEYKNLDELYKDNDAETVYPIQGIYINRKSEYGDAPVAILMDCFANLPKHMLDECLEILKDDDDINQIKAGCVGFVIEPYESDKKKGKDKTCYGVKWVDIDD